MQHILIADDNEDITEVLGTYVVSEGFELNGGKDIGHFEMFKKCNPGGGITGYHDQGWMAIRFAKRFGRYRMYRSYSSPQKERIMSG